MPSYTGLGQLRCRRPTGVGQGRTSMSRFMRVKSRDKMRIERVAPTIRELIDKGARVIIVSHLGRPHGVVDTSLSLRPVAPALAAALGGRPVSFAEDCVGPVAQKVGRGSGGRRGSRCSRTSDSIPVRSRTMRRSPGPSPSSRTFMSTMRFPALTAHTPPSSPSPAGYRRSLAAASKRSSRRSIARSIIRPVPWWR